MADQNQDAALREAARARGFRLVKSRRRKPGGDFGLYGLVGIDSGRECLGFGEGGFTATAQEVHAFLRGGEVASWKRSLIGVVGEGEGSKEPARPERSRKARDTAPTKSPARLERSRETPDEEAEEKEARTTPSTKSRRGARAARAAPPDAPPAIAGGAGSGPSSSSEPKADLDIREATRRDAATLARLIGIPAPTLAERLAAAIKAGEPPLVAARGGEPVGLAAWTILSTLHQSPRGRITLLIVAEGERRQGIGRSLFEAAEQHLAEAGVAATELLLDIDFDAPTAFLRRTGWTRTTNGYGKAIG